MAGRRQRDYLSRFSVHFFRLGVSKQNGVSFHRLRDALKRHPCRIGLNRASLHGFPYVLTFCQETPAENEARKIRDR